MKRGSITLLQTVTVLIAISALVLLLWEPHIEGRNAHAGFFQIYFHDPFLAYAYLASLPFFVALHHAFKALGSAGRDKASPQAAVKSLRTIKRCAVSMIAFVVVGEIFIFLGESDDRAGGVFMGVLIALGSIVVAAAAAKFERILKNATILLLLFLWVGPAHADHIGHFANTDCSALPDETAVLPGDDTPKKLRDLCLGQRAWFEKRADFCDAMSTPADVRRCRSWMTIRLKKPEMCRKIPRSPDETPWIQDKLTPDHRGQAPYFDCLRSYANWTRSPGLCAKIPYRNPKDREECEKTARAYTLWDERKSPI
jgi:hypothetical protein